MIKRGSAKGEGRQPIGAPPANELHHVLVVGGTIAEWNALSSDQWIDRRSDLAKVAAHAGVQWLTVLPYEQGSTGEAPTMAREIDARDNCTVIIDPSADGRQRLLAVVEQLRSGGPEGVDEAAIAAKLMAPAPVEPDLTVILGPSDRLPPSLVWELAYSEIVFLDVRWDDLAAAHIEHSIDEFSRRHRRFGGLG